MHTLQTAASAIGSPPLPQPPNACSPLASAPGPHAERLVPPEHRGSYLGVIDRLPDILASGATAVVLSNVFLSSLTAAPPHDPEADAGGVAWPTCGGKLRRPLSFMAPEVGLAAGDDPLAAAPQLKALVAALHKAGLEVLLEVRGRGGRGMGGGQVGGIKARGGFGCIAAGLSHGVAHVNAGESVELQ